MAYACTQCGSVSTKWQGQCRDCQAWDTLQEAPAVSQNPNRSLSSVSVSWETLQQESGLTSDARFFSGIVEFDRVVGGGLTAGSTVLVGGDPGIGKSTLLLQILAGLSRGVPVAYLSGEEALDQIRARAKRLGLEQATVALAVGVHLNDVMPLLLGNACPKVVVVDSIQTMRTDSTSGLPGSVNQIRACAHELICAAKAKGFVLFLVSHVTKEGTIAGPKVLEHMVDTVLYFEGERGHSFRLLRTVKNRFGPVDEIGVFGMSAQGLQEIANPSELFLSQGSKNPVAGSCIFAGIEGTRPLFVEIQALVSASTLGTPRRSVVGWDSSRLAMVLAVLETRGRFSVAQKDVFLNVVGGVKLGETAVDLAAAVALISSVQKKPLSRSLFVFGELGLGGEIRLVPRMDARLREGAKLGLTQTLAPAQAPDFDGVDVVPFHHISEVVDWFKQNERL